MVTEDEELLAGRGLGYDWVARILRPLDEIVILARGQTGELVLAPHPRIDDGWHAVVDDGAPRETAVLIRAFRARCEGDRQMLPVHEVVADRVPPMHQAP